MPVCQQDYYQAQRFKTVFVKETTLRCYISAVLFI